MKRLTLLILSSIALQLAGAGATACTVEATPLNFLSIDPLAGSDSTATATISVDCTDSGAASFSVSLTTGSAGHFNPRTMHSGSHTLAYRLHYGSFSSAQIWGDGTGGTITWTGSTSGSVQQTVYGVVPSQSSAYPGSYMDSVTITVTF